MQYNFKWDHKKAKANRTKHKVNFELAATVFKDPKAISIYDNAHSGEEDRWITLGLASNGSVLVVHHTYERIDRDNITIRVISSRKAIKNEKKQYTEL